MDMSWDGRVSLAIKGDIHTEILYICVFQELKHLWTNNKTNLLELWEKRNGFKAFKVLNQLYTKAYSHILSVY